MFEAHFKSKINLASAHAQARRLTLKYQSQLDKMDTHNIKELARIEAELFLKEELGVPNIRGLLEWDDFKIVVVEIVGAAT